MLARVHDDFIDTHLLQRRADGPGLDELRTGAPMTVRTLTEEPRKLVSTPVTARAAGRNRLRSRAGPE